MSGDPRRGFTVRDLLAVVGVLGVFLGLLIPAINAAREAGRRTQCSNNMRQLGLALLNFEASKNRFPNAGTFYDDPAVHQGDPTKSNIYLSITEPAKLADGGKSWLYNWVVEIMPYLDSSDEPNAWDKTVPYWWATPTIAGYPANSVLSNTGLGVFRCPDDTSAQPGQGNLSYVVNGGFARWHAIPVGWTGSSLDGRSGNGGVLEWAPAGSAWEESQAVARKMGVMFLGTHTGDQPWDIKTDPRDITDGASHTLLIAENTLAGSSPGNPYSNGVPTNWACPLPNFTMFVGSDDVCRSDRSPTDCLGGQLKPNGGDGPGWARANQSGTFENIGYGRNLTVKGSFPFVTSGHPDGSNMVFCDGAVRFMRNSIDGTAYAKLITPAGNRLPGTIRQGPLGQDVFDP